MSAQGSPCRDHSQGSQRSHASKKSSSSSNSTASRASKSAYPPSYHAYQPSPPRGRSHRRREEPTRSRSSSSSSSACSAENWPFSVRDIEDLNSVINKHLDDLAKSMAAIELTEDNIERYEDDMDDMNWQMFLFRTGACRPRAGSEEEPWAQNPDSIVSEWKHAARQKHRARKCLEQQEAICADGVSILFKLLSERNRRNLLAVGKR